MSKCIHANKLHDNLWCSTACMYCTLSQEETCRHRKDIPDTKVAKTNADHIRSLSDDELAEFLCGVYDDENCGVYQDECGKFICGVTIIDYDQYKIVDWLKQPYGGDT